MSATGAHGGTAEPTYGAIALGAVVFSVVFWSFGFLRMGTTGFVAQAAGRGDSAEVRAIAARGLVIAAVVGAVLVLLQRPIVWASLALLDAPADVAAPTARYIALRIWAAPASLATFTVLGALIGLGRTRAVLVVQVVLNGVNIGLDVAVRRATLLAAASALGLAALVVLGGPAAIARLTNLTEVRLAAAQHLPYTAAYIALAFAAFQLDGVFIGATATRAMRQASIASCLGFVALSLPAMALAGSVGLWLAFIGYVVLRRPGVGRTAASGAGLAHLAGIGAIERACGLPMMHVVWNCGERR